MSNEQMDHALLRLEETKAYIKEEEDRKLLKRAKKGGCKVWSAKCCCFVMPVINIVLAIGIYISYQVGEK
jgi:hypothetical protein